MAKFVLILYVPGIPALSMSDIDFDFGGVWPKEIIKSNRDCLYVLVRNVTLLLLLLFLTKKNLKNDILPWKKKKKCCVTKVAY